MTEKIQMNGSLHSHGCWTDHRNPNETARFPFDLETFARLCIEIGRDFQVISEIKDHPKEPARWHNERRYHDLMKTIRKSDNYEVERAGDLYNVYFKRENKRVVIIRGQEVSLANPVLKGEESFDSHLKHVSAIGVERELKGGLSAEETLKIIREESGYAFPNHPFMVDAWSEEELLDFYERKLISAIEFNSGLTFPACLDNVLGKRTPSKKSNKRVLALEDRIPVVANDDAHSEEDMKKGASTSYNVVSGLPFIYSIFDAIARRDFSRQEKYTSFLSPIWHMLDIEESEKLSRQGKLIEY